MHDVPSSDDPDGPGERAYGATPPPRRAGPHDRQPDAFLDRPLSSFTVRDALKGYAVYLLVALVIGVIGIAAVLSSSDSGDDGAPGPGGGGTFSLDRGDAPMVSTADFRSLKLGATRAAVERKLGKGQKQAGGNPFDQTVGGTGETCFVYPLEGPDVDTVALLCYADGRLITRERL